jgi:N-carbamoylputrescine amidase
VKNSQKTVMLGLLQHACGIDPKANLAATLESARAAARDGAQIICTQELFGTQYFCQSENHGNYGLAEPIHPNPGPTTQAFQTLAREEKVVVIASIFEQRAPGLFHNTAAIIDADGALLGIYRKMHIRMIPSIMRNFTSPPAMSAMSTTPASAHGKQRLEKSAC